ncbi:MAG: N-acetylmuramoyl-L-alanine amidase, partial [Nocardioidaceae bacterium]
AHLRAPVASGFSMLGVTWKHDSVASGGIDVRVRARAHGSWSRWTSLHSDPDEGPSPGEDSAVRDGTEPVYVGDAHGVEVAVFSADGSRPRQLKVDAIDPGSSSYDATAVTTSASPTTSAKDGFPGMPTIITRRQWGADESLGDQCWSPRYGSAFKAVFIHHTAGSNTYSESESASVVRGIYAYHTQSRGWCDIGYNFLVDRFGNIYEGRDGGIRRPVRGAHAGDYNVNSTGISLMGTFETVSPSRAMKKSVVRLVTWRLGTAYHGGYGHPRINGKLFARISGHRDAMSTACPGQRAYDWLPRLRVDVNSSLDHFASPIKSRWLDQGGSRSALGPVRIGEAVARDGHHTTFRHGRMYSSVNGLFTLKSGPLLTTYLRAGEVGGKLGYPTSKIRTPKNGYAANFQGGSIYWSPQTRGRILPRSAVLKRYRAEKQAFGPLGFPKTTIRASKDRSSARFQHGTITYDKKTRRTTVSYE